MATRSKEVAAAEMKAVIEALGNLVDDYSAADSRALRRFAKLFDAAPGLKLSTIIEQIRATAESRATRQ